MAQSKESQKTFGKTKNSKVYIARSSNSFDVCDEHEPDSPRRNSVPLIRSVFESTSPEKPAWKTQKVSAKSSSPCSPETKKSSLETVCELKQSDNLTSNYDTKKSKSSCEVQNKASGCVTSNDDLYHSNVRSYVSPNTADRKINNDPCDTNISDGQGSKSIRPGTLRLQPASNVRGPLVNTEYLKLTKFNDITVYCGSKKISKVSVDELDKKIDDRCFPVAAADAVEYADDAFVDKSLDDSEDSDSLFDLDFVFEFVETETSVNRPALKTSKSLIKKQVSFSQELTSVFEYPSECDTSDSHLTNSDSDQETITPKTVTSKSLQSSPGCSGAGYLGLYQPRLLERGSVIPYYSSDALLDCTIGQQSTATIHSQPKDTPLMAKGSAFGSCSAEESSWSGGNSGTELLF